MLNVQADFFVALVESTRDFLASASDEEPCPPRLLASDVPADAFQRFCDSDAAYELLHFISYGMRGNCVGASIRAVLIPLRAAQRAARLWLRVMRLHTISRGKM